jgi:hypothetical protein
LVEELLEPVLPDVPLDDPLFPLAALDPSEFVFLLDTLGFTFLELSGFIPLSSAAKAGAAISASAAAAAKIDFMNFLLLSLSSTNDPRETGVPGKKSQSTT